MAVLLRLVALLAVVSAAQACVCMPEHPQSHYCSADFAIRARVINSTTREGDYFSPQVYNLKIEKIYKGENAIKNANGVDSDEARLTTPSAAISCAVYLKPGEVYLLTGVINHEKQLHTGFCNWHKAWHRLTHSQRAGVRRNYGANCHCGLGSSFCYDADCEKKLPGCSETGWSFMAYTRGLCRRMYTFCKAVSDSKCQWVETPQYIRCGDDMP